jgi:signal transduction histidine kinase
VDRPVKKITDAAEQIMQGNLDIRIEKLKTIDLENGLNVIIDDINRMAKELSGMETLRTDFIANVSHELKTPLAVMQNYGTLLQQPDLPEEQRMEYARAITEASQSLANMVSNILKLNKLENQTIYPATVTYDLGEQLCECLVGLEEVWDKKGLDIEADVAEDVYVTADPELLTLVWNNLFSNAIKFTEAGGKISLTLKSEGGKAVVQVADTGCGISPEVGKHIFEKFYQGDTSHAAKGNGLGLALVKRVMDITGGDISVSSEVGRGSVFTVTLARANKGVNALARLESGGDYKQHEQEGEDG